MLREAGLSRGTVSLDSLDDSVFRAMNDRDVPKNRLGCTDFPGSRSSRLWASNPSSETLDTAMLFGGRP